MECQPSNFIWTSTTNQVHDIQLKKMYRALNIVVFLLCSPSVTDGKENLSGSFKNSQCLFQCTLEGTSVKYQKKKDCKASTYELKQIFQNLWTLISKYLPPINYNEL